MLNASRVLCAIGGVLFVIAALGHGLGVTATSQTDVELWGLAFFAAGHVF